MTDHSSFRTDRETADIARPAARRFGKIAYRWIHAYALANRQFIGEECTKAARAAGVRRPHDPRAWGSAFWRAARDGIIRRIGYAQSPLRDHAPTILWQSARCRNPDEQTAARNTAPVP